MIERMLAAKSMEVFKSSLATLTGGSGAVAVLLTDGSFAAGRQHQLLGGVTQAAPEFHGLCRWGMESLAAPLTRSAPSASLDQKIEATLLATLHQKLRAVLPGVLAQRVEGLMVAALRQNLEGILPGFVAQRIE